MTIDTIEFRNLTFSYESGKPILHDIDFTFPMGKNILISGDASSGRSTLLKVLAGISRPQKGSYFLNGLDVCDMSFEEFQPYRRKIGYTFDYGGLLANKTLWDNLMLPLLYHAEVSYAQAEKRVSDVIRRFGFWEGRDRRPASVSGGMRKTCIVARAFVMQPQLLLMDDPFVALDAAASNAITQLMSEYREQGFLKHVIFTSKFGKSVDSICDLTLTMHEGKLHESEKRLGKVVGL